MQNNSLASKIADKAQTAAANVKNAAKVPSDKSGIISIVLQVLVGIVATYLLYLIALQIMKSDKMIIDEKYDQVKKRSITVVDGFIDASMQGIHFNTDVPFASNYVPIKPSVNIKGGAQFTYSFWINLGPGATDTNVANKVIFLKGVNKKYTFTQVDNKYNTRQQVLNERLVMCPMFKFGNNAKSFELVFNTLNKYDEKLIIDSTNAQDSVYRNNLLAVISNSWFLITMTFEDNIPINEFENGLVVKFYVNDTLYKVGRYSSALKQNYGDLYLFPNDTESTLADVKVSNLRYYNYVLADSEVRALASGGANTKSSGLYMSPSSAKPPLLSDYNKLDIYNV